MANNINLGQIIANEALDVIENSLVFTKGVNREYKKEWDKKRDFKIGDTVTVTKPARFVGRTGKALSIEDYTEEDVQVTLDSQLGVDVAFDSAELTTEFNIDLFREKVLEPQVSFVANQIDLKGMQLAAETVANTVGTPGTIPNAVKTYSTAGALMSLYGAPTANRGLVIDPMAEVEVIDSLKGLFNSTSQLKSQYEDGKMGRAAGFDWAMSQSVHSRTIGAQGGTPLVNGAGQTGASLVTDGWSNSVTGLLLKGDVFTIAGVYGVNPITKKSTGRLQQFVVTADANSSAGGAATLVIWPQIITSGPKQTVNAGPADNAAITVLGTGGTVSPTHIASHKNAFAFVSADLPLPKGMEIAGRASSRSTGISVRFVRGYDITNDRFISRLDVLCGWKELRPEWACKIQG